MACQCIAVKHFCHTNCEHDIWHGNTLRFLHGVVTLRHFGKAVKNMTLDEFQDEFPLLSYVMGRDRCRRPFKKKALAAA